MTGAPHPHGRHRWGATAVDVALAVAVTVADTTLTARIWHLDNPYAQALLGAQALADLTLVLWRRAPLVVLAAVGAVGVLQFGAVQFASGWLWPVPVDSIWVVVPLGTPFAAFAVVVYGTRRRLGWALVALLTLLAVRPWPPNGTVLAVGLLMTVIPALAGISVAARRRLMSALAERAERAVREQHLLAERARADERARLAREMHDVVTHRVSLMVLQAGALRTVAPDERTRLIADQLRADGCTALEELRDFVGVLRSPPTPADTEATAGPAGDPHPPEALPDLSTLVDQARSAGTTVDVQVAGDPLVSSPAVGRTAYRVVQEALTNVAKHAPGAHVNVRVHYATAEVRLSITDTGARRPPDPALTRTGSGAGLYGLRQRVELVGGSLSVGRRAGGGFRVRASLPAFVPTTPLAHPREMV